MYCKNQQKSIVVKCQAKLNLRAVSSLFGTESASEHSTSWSQASSMNFITHMFHGRV